MTIYQTRLSNGYENKQMLSKEDITKEGIIVMIIVWSLFAFGIFLFDGHLNNIVEVLTG